jgi:hypothetical protein
LLSSGEIRQPATSANNQLSPFRSPQTTLTAATRQDDEQISHDDPCQFKTVTKKPAAPSGVAGSFGPAERVGGAEGDRTPDLCNAIAALSQLSYGP